MQQFPDISEVIRLAQSPAGQQLITLLQQSGGSNLQDAVSKASSGDYAQAKNMLSSLLNSPDAKALLKQLEEMK